MTKSWTIQGSFVAPRPGNRDLAQAGAKGRILDAAVRSLSLDEAGSRLPTPILNKLEAYFGEELRDIRVHEGPQADALGALAFTVGNHVFFARGRYKPFTRRGLRLLGHEVAHALQQRHGAVRGPEGEELTVVDDPVLEALPRHHGRALAEPNALQSHVERGSREGGSIAEPSAPPPPRVLQASYPSDGEVLKSGGKLDAPRFSTHFGGYIRVLGPDTLRHQLIEELATGQHYIYDRAADTYESVFGGLTDQRDRWSERSKPVAVSHGGSTMV
jgi:hypothetical protein